MHRTVRQRRKDGHILDLALHGVPLLLNGEVRGAYLIYEDISEQDQGQRSTAATCGVAGSAGEGVGAPHRADDLLE